jgi:inositol-1,4,5-trisphosphate 5-phosphatase
MSDGEASEAGSEELRALLVTHNVCGVFDNLENALPFWVKELQALVREQGADFVALHMQEVGGTAWKKGNLRLETFTQAFEAGFPEFWCSGLLCDNCTQTPEAFSALGSLYLVTPRLA